MSTESEPSTDRPGDRPAAGEEAAARIGRSLGRFARAARKVARAQQPEAERLAQQAVAAARPVAARASQFVREHEAEIKQLGGSAARAAAYRAAPAPLRPVVSAVTDELLRDSPESTDEHQAPAADDAEAPEGARD